LDYYRAYETKPLGVFSVGEIFPSDISVRSHGRFELFAAAA
jgi:hypothetical protein